MNVNWKYVSDGDLPELNKVCTIATIVIKSGKPLDKLVEGMLVFDSRFNNNCTWWLYVRNMLAQDLQVYAWMYQTDLLAPPLKDVD